ncbi:MAG TPA: hypothetical protein VMV22_08725 [Acidimicrobiales bacterium]|nr:hypothetical protein [Acidimicrobiales bacterium]
MARGLGIAALAWALGSSDWRGYWSEFWTTARAQLTASDTVTGSQRPTTDTSATIKRDAGAFS